MNTSISINNNILLPQNWYNMAETAKLINANMGRTKLFRFLRDEGVLMHDNEPHQQYIDSGYFKVVTKDLPYYGGRYLSPKFVTLVSSKGIDFIKDLIKKQEGSNGKN